MVSVAKTALTKCEGGLRSLHATKDNKWAETTATIMQRWECSLAQCIPDAVDRRTGALQTASNLMTIRAVSN